MENYWLLASQNHKRDGVCRKAVVGSGPSRYQSPGVFITACEHGVVYSFHLMVDPEGRKDVFYVLYERMPKEVLDKLTVVCINHKQKHKQSNNANLSAGAKASQSTKAHASGSTSICTSKSSSGHSHIHTSFKRYSDLQFCVQCLGVLSQP